jgi:serine/threonine protein kinase
VKFDGPLLNDRWRLGPRLGAGAQARTFLARDEKADAERVVVVKELRLGAAADSSWKKFDLFEREVRVLKSLDHPGIPRFIESFEGEPGVFHLVMDKAPGATLRAFAKKRIRFSDAQLRDVMIRVLDILGYLHSLNPPVIHRDIKPANLLRGKDGAISLVDFGGVRDVLRQEGGSTVVGTFGYMAPEQLHGQATPATDLYALGATVVALAGGIEPEHVPRRGLRMDLRKHLAPCDPDLVDILEQLTEPDPEKRPQSAADVLDLLRGKPGRQLSTISPGEVAPPPEGDAHSVEVIRRTTDEIGEFIADLPRPLRAVMRVIFFLVFAGGYLGLTVVRVALLPIIFGLVGAFSSDKKRPEIADVRRKVGAAIDEGRAGCRALSTGGRRRKRRRALPRTRED